MIEQSKKIYLSLIVCFIFFIFSPAYGFFNFGNNKPTILIGSPVHQKPEILNEFLESLQSLDKEKFDVTYYFIDDNKDSNSSNLLADFKKNHKDKCIIQQSNLISASAEYQCNEETHIWTNNLIWKVAGFKDNIIEYAKIKNFDYLFLIDSDIVLNPKTLNQLVDAKKDIISNIFWTQFTPEQYPMPQVWMSDQYKLYEVGYGEQLSNEEIQKRTIEFIAKLRTPGVYEVGGLGACTLINKHALCKGVNFKPVKNITFSGEDRHFCIRASSLGLDLFVDTHYPAYHIYRESCLASVADFKRSCKKIKDPSQKPRITLSMAVKNESKRYLREVLTSAKSYITDAVIIDDASTDDTVKICKEILCDIPLKIVQNPTSKFNNEITLRMQQWNETIATDPDWIVFLDADQIFESQFSTMIEPYLSVDYIDAFQFRLYDFWDENHYREDNYWNAHLRFNTFMVRYRPELPYIWNTQTPQHCGSFPSTATMFLSFQSPIRLKHYGWAKAEDRLEKYKRYELLDPGAIYGIKEQYESILDPNPHLVKWYE